MLTNDNLLEKMIEIKKMYIEVSHTHWIVAEVYKWQWWFSIVMLFLPMWIWWKLLDKKRIFEIVTYGLLTNILASFIDVVGSEYLLWDYPIRIHPNIPRLLPFDFVIVPITYMLLYQWFPKWKQYLIAVTVSAIMGCVAIEPLFVWMNLYKLLSWKYIYSFPCYLFIGISCKWLNSKFEKVKLNAAKS